MLKIFSENSNRCMEVKEVEALESLVNFIKTYNNEIQHLRTKIEKLEKMEDMPVFRLPSWPEGIEVITVNLGLKKFDVPIAREGLRTDLPFKDVVALETDRQKLTVEVYGGGNILIKTRKLVKKEYFFSEVEWERSLRVASDSKNALERLQCFVVFHQFLGEICGAIVKELSRDVEIIKNRIESNQLLIPAVKRSFEPLIPFVVADILNEEGT